MSRVLHQNQILVCENTHYQYFNVPLLLVACCAKRAYIFAFANSREKRAFTWAFMRNFCTIAILANLLETRRVSWINFSNQIPTKKLAANIDKLHLPLLHAIYTYTNKHTRRAKERERENVYVERKAKGGRRESNARGSVERISLPCQSSFREHFRRVLQNC